MRPQSDLRVRRVRAAMGALCLTCAAATTAVTSAGAQAPSDPGASSGAARGGPVLSSPAVDPAPTATLAVHLRRDHLRFGEPVVVRGHLSPAGPGQAVGLEFRAVGSVDWQLVRQGLVDQAGAYRLAGVLRRSGEVRVSELESARSRLTPTLPGPAASVASGASAPRPVTVAAAIAITRRNLDTLAGRQITVAGTLAPRRGGRVVALQVRARHGWETISRTRTGARGRYRLGFTPRHTMSRIARVSFAGDRFNGPSRRGLGRVSVYREAVASWYGPGLYGSALACGGSLNAGTLGVANRTLPCGTPVTLRYHGHTVTVPVVDRGPFVAGREFDLTAATKQALGFGDTGTVWTTR